MKTLPGNEPGPLTNRASMQHYYTIGYLHYQP